MPYLRLNQTEQNEYITDSHSSSVSIGLAMKMDATEEKDGI
jgi:hypothetical protein